MPSRRVFLKSSALAMFGMGSVPTWLSRALYAKDAPSERGKILIAIFQRGAVDGLNVVVPHSEAAYYAMRPSIGIPRPDGTEGSAIDLDGHFGLHPALRSLKPLWDRRQLAIVEAVGSTDPTRSHFDAQDYMESGTPGLKATYDGWLNRAMLPEAHPTSLRAISLSADLPRTLRGRNPALAVGNVNDFQIKDARLAAAFESMYGSTADLVLNGTGRETFDAIKIMQSIQRTPYTPANGAHYPNGRLGQSLQQIAHIIKGNIGLEVAFTDVGGWDTHVNEVGPEPHTGQLANLLRDFGDALAAFSQDMGDRMGDITVVTMSEFGRTAKENGDRGTDHGHANVMFVLGGNVRGGQIYGDWPGLRKEQLYQGRDLNVTTDFRAVFSELVLKQMGNGQLASVFPGFDNRRMPGLLAT
ncbi:MAG: DUF1501 domain-containing protein [Acidobacteriaceae bacterium]|nr:DUF1501 domain-containing protein [Acidobacteriaceae bacterium]MBV9441603.1 DUF1501 domain-containing protein [Acidobacteriaceae bacterium]